MLEELKFLDKTLQNFEVTTYDFLAQDDLLDYDGVIGLDFFKGTILTIDFEKQQLYSLLIASRKEGLQLKVSRLQKKHQPLFGL